MHYWHDPNRPILNYIGSLQYSLAKFSKIMSKNRVSGDSTSNSSSEEKGDYAGFNRIWSKMPHISWYQMMISATAGYCCIINGLWAMYPNFAQYKAWVWFVYPAIEQLIVFQVQPLDRCLLGVTLCLMMADLSTWHLTKFTIWRLPCHAETIHPNSISWTHVTPVIWLVST